MNKFRTLEHIKEIQNALDGGSYITHEELKNLVNRALLSEKNAIHQRELMCEIDEATLDIHSPEFLRRT